MILPRKLIQRSILCLLLVAPALVAGCKDSKSEDSEKSNKDESAQEEKKSDKSDKSDKPKRDKKSDKGDKTADKVAADSKPKDVEKTPDGVKIEFTKPVGSVSKLTLSNMPTVKGSVACFGGTGCKVDLEKLPAGTKVKVGSSKEEEADGKKTLHVEFDILEEIGKASTDDALKYDKTVDPKLTLEITFPDEVKVSAPLPGITTKYYIEQMMEKDLPNGRPVLFGKDEPLDPPKQHTILFLDALLDRESLIGPAKVMSEVDLVAVKEVQPKRSGEKKCKGYKPTGGKGPETEADLMLVDWEIKLIERKTAKVVDSKKFEGEKKCPYVASNGEASSYPDRRAIQTWLRTKR